MSKRPEFKGLRVPLLGLAALTSATIVTSVSSRALGRPPACIAAFATSRTPIQFSGARDAIFENEINEVMPQIERLLGRSLDISVQLTNSRFYSEAFYLPKETAVKIGIGLGDRSPLARIGVFTHEATHHYSKKELRYEILGQWLNEADARKALSNHLRAIENEPVHLELTAKREILSDLIHKERNRGNNPVFEERVREFHAIRAQQELRIQSFAKGNAELNKKVQIARAYYELFSDVIAALITKERGIVADALGYAPQGPYIGDTPGASLRRKNPDGARPRSFEINKFKNWSPEKSFGNEYVVLDPARGVLWELYLKDIPDSLVPKFSEVYRLATEREVERLFQMGADENLVVSPAPPEINRDFLRTFREIAEEHGLKVQRK